MPPRIVVVGSVNLDLVVRVERLPAPGETVGGGSFSRVPGGKGANQAVACARLGADVTMVAAVGRDAVRGGGARGAPRDRRRARAARDASAPTGVALIQVDGAGETTIAVAPGRQRGARGGRAAAARRGPLPARDARRGGAVGLGGVHRAVLPQRRARAADRRRRRPHRRQPARARGARRDGTGSSR